MTDLEQQRMDRLQAERLEALNLNARQAQRIAWLERDLKEAQKRLTEVARA